MIGNAVPVNLAYHIAMSIKDALDKHGVVYNANDDEIINVCRNRFAPLSVCASKHKNTTYLELNLFSSEEETILSMAREPEP